MNKRLWLMLTGCLALTACSEPPAVKASEPGETSLEVPGRWIVESDGRVMKDPQTSGLTHFNGMLATISDGSADKSQQRRIHFIDPATAMLTPRPDSMGLASAVRRSCFSAYLSDEPDLEALVADPRAPGTFYTITEDATRTGALSPRCQQRYSDTGSTDYPTLLVRITRDDTGNAVMRDVRPLRFSHSLNVGDFPNDGIEGMAISPDGTLYLGLEKDANGQPRIFSVTIDDTFWDTTDFADVAAPELDVPVFDGGNHPINGLEYYDGYLLAAARNDNELWVIDTQHQAKTQRVVMHFTAPTLVEGGDCPATERMDNASIEGLAVIDDTLWLINDPWKVNYMKNVQCDANRARYEAMAPLLFSVPLDASWFTRAEDKKSSS